MVPASINDNMILVYLKESSQGSVFLKLKAQLYPLAVSLWFNLLRESFHVLALYPVYFSVIVVYISSPHNNMGHTLHLNGGEV